MAPSPPASSDAAGHRMRSTPKEGTRAELAIRRRLWSRGQRFRVQFRVPGLPRRRIDIAFPRVRLAVFVDGCFWHRCPEHYSMPRANKIWWQDKLERNVIRDAETTEHLKMLGWSVVRIWEHETPELAVDRIEAELSARAAQAPAKSRRSHSENSARDDRQ